MKVRRSIEYVCQMLQSLGVCNGELSPEILRKAKFNHPSVSSVLLRALHDLVALNLSAFPSLPPHRPRSRSRPRHHQQRQNDGVNQSDKHSEERSRRCMIAGRKTPCKIQCKSTRMQPAKGKVRPQYGNSSVSRDCKVKINGILKKDQKAKCRCAREILGELWQRFGKNCPDKAIEFVKFYLALWGYPPHSPFFTLPGETRQSRQLLLAIGWMISHCQMFQRGVEMRIAPLIAVRNRAPIPPYPHDVSSCEEAVQIAKHAEAGAREYVKRVLDTSNRISDPKGRSAARVHQVLMLYGRVQTALKSLYSLESCKALRIHELNQVQVDIGIENKYGRLYTQYEVYLLQDKPARLVHAQAAKADRQIGIEMEENQKHYKVFWEWMASVVQEALNEEENHLPNSENGKKLQDDDHREGEAEAEAEEMLSLEVLQPVIEFLQKQLLKMKEGHAGVHRDEKKKGTGEGEDDDDNGVQVLPDSVVNALARSLGNGANKVECPTTSKESGKGCTGDDGLSDKDQNCDLRSFLSDLSVLQPLFVRDTKNKRQGKMQTANFGGHATAEKTIQSLKNIAVDLTRILARTRAQNKAVIQKALQPIIEDKNFVLVGL